MKDTPYYLPVYTFKENSTVFYLSSKGCKQNAILTLLDHQIMTTRSPSMYFSIPPHPAFETIWRKYFKYIFLFSFLGSSFMDESIMYVRVPSKSKKFSDQYINLVRLVHWAKGHLGQIWPNLAKNWGRGRLLSFFPTCDKLKIGPYKK